MFKKAQVGDYVWSCIHGDGKIIKIWQDSNRPIQVQFLEHYLWYATTGKHHVSDLYSELYHHPLKRKNL